MTEGRHPTKEKLLDAAERLFAEHGFEAVSVRELAAAADVNVAAVNYHFQGKDNLFHQVIRRRFSAQRDRTLAALDGLQTATEGRPTVAQVIEVLVGQYVCGALGEGGGFTFLTFVTREMNSGHTSASAPFFREMVAPIMRAFSRALVTARPSLQPEDVTWVMASIVGQIHHFCIRWLKRRQMENDPESLQIIRQAFPALELPLPEYVRQVTAHITRFSTAAVDGVYPEVHA